MALFKLEGLLVALPLLLFERALFKGKAKNHSGKLVTLNLSF